MSNELCSWSRRKCQMQLVLYFVCFKLEHIHPSFFEVVEPIEVPIFEFCSQLIVLLPYNKACISKRNDLQSIY